MRRLVILLTFLSLVNAYADKSLYPKNKKEVIASTLKHFPMILQSLIDIELARNKERESLGAFDAKLNIKNDQRIEGYYSGNLTELKIEKPLTFLNAKIYGGHRVGRGEFPVYEGKYETLDGGESMIGLSLSLLQDRDIDLKRLKLLNNKINTTQKEQKAKSVAVKVKKMAIKAYWKWLAKYKTYLVLKDLYELSLNRQVALIKKIKRGDIANIYQVENKQYILKRKNNVLEAKQELENAALELSLYYRDDEGKPKILPLPTDDIPFMASMGLKDSKVNDDINRAVHIAPDLVILASKLDQYRNERRIGENKLMPKLDLNLEVSKDAGEGSKKLAPQENRAMITFEIPIERNLGKGKVAKANAKIRSLQYQLNYSRDQLRAKALQLRNKINTQIQKIENSVQEVELAEILQKAEVKKFERGASDFFVINIREQNTADAKVKLIKANLEYQKNLAEYEALLFYPI